jgi:hypothetical protein
MKKVKFCETLKPGYYLLDDKFTGLKRCVYATGTTKGNKWIDLTSPNPQWVALMWNCISQDEISKSVYYEQNPTEYFDLSPKITTWI